VPDPLLVADEVAEAAIDRGVPGLVVGIVDDGAPVLVKAYGKLERENVIRVGSITKVFTAIGIMQLVEQGLIDLDDPVEQHLRAYAFEPAWRSRPATVREVLTHTGGFGEFRRLREWRATDIPFGVDDGQRIPPLAEFYKDGLRGSTAPGRGYSYANHAFATLGQVVEDVSGLPYDRYIRERILVPLGMTNSDILLTDALRPRLAQGYHVTETETIEVPLQHIVIAPAGSLFSTVDDMLRFTAWVASTGEQISRDVLKPETLALMFERHFEPDVRLPGQGLGFARDDIANEVVVGHDGGWPGFVSTFAAVPGRRFGVFACATAIDLGPKNVANRSIEALLDASIEPPADLPLPPGYERHAGVYAPILGLSADARWWNEYGGELRIHAATDGLILSSPRGPHEKGTRLRPGDPDDARFWVGTAQRLGSTQAIKVRFNNDDRGFDGAVPQIARMRKRPAVRSVQFYKPAWRIGRVAAPMTIVSAVAGLLLRRRARAARDRTAHRSLLR
jgi:CubicO group peptidase (beta-lactamase class C family)